jgi:hypothetical protein
MMRAEEHLSGVSRLRSAHINVVISDTGYKIDVHELNCNFQSETAPVSQSVL